MSTAPSEAQKTRENPSFARKELSRAQILHYAAHAALKE